MEGPAPGGRAGSREMEWAQGSPPSAPKNYQICWYLQHPRFGRRGFELVVFLPMKRGKFLLAGAGSVIVCNWLSSLVCPPSVRPSFRQLDLLHPSCSLSLPLPPQPSALECTSWPHIMVESRVEGGGNFNKPPARSLARLAQRPLTLSAL